MWQKLYEELEEEGLTIITVAMDSRGAASARGPIRRAKPTHPSLIDRHHVVAALYNMTNVPQAVWIDEQGRIVRPTEVSGAVLSFNFRKMRETRRIYCDAIRDWVRNGKGSKYVFSDDDARAHLPALTPQIALAHASFRLGEHLWDAGNREEGARFLEQAVELYPDSWNFFRQMKNLEHVLGSSGPDFWRRVRAKRKQGKDYYPLPDMAGMAKLAR